MKTIISAFLILGMLAFAVADETEGDTTKMKDIMEQEEKVENPIVLMHISHGDSALGTVEIEVYEHDMPYHGGNFLQLVDEGYYDSLTFHRVVDGFVIQGGDPTGTGTGGPPGRLQDDENCPYKHDYATISMARSPAGASKSQFYVNMRNNYSLDSQGFLVFAKVIKGMDIFEKIAKFECAGNRQAPKPVVDVIMTKVERKPMSDKPAKENKK